MGNGLILSEAYHTNDPHIRVVAFVVDESKQGKGIGKELMKAAEQWGGEQGVRTVILNSGNREERKKTHEIYRHYGCDGKATGFYKEIHVRIK